MTDLTSAVLELMAARDYLPADVSELARRLRLAPRRKPELQQTLSELERAGRVARIKGDRYVQPREADLVPGRIRINRQGKGFLQPDTPGLPEIVVPEAETGTALHEDRVLVRRDVPAKGLRGGAPVPATGTVVRILERRRTQIVGTLQKSRQFLFVAPDDPRIPHDIYVPPARDTGRPARPGDKVVVELREWVSRHTNPEGEIVEVLGALDEEGVDMLSVLRQYGLPLHFPREVLHEARSHGDTVTPADLAGRTDCRAHNVVTIDPDDAKDFDDAICLEPADEGHWRLWVHIADVSHYVRPGTVLDTEARRRGNSTYLVDRVIPMLPEALSNELCSLKPHVDRLTKCIEFRLSDDGQVLSTRFYPAVIHSRRRHTYGEVLTLLGRDPVDSIERMLHDAHRIAQRIRRHRFKAGSLDLDFPETKIRLDDQGHVLRIEKTENDVSHQLIEEFMLLANEAAATRLIQQRTPAVHRVHEPPDERRLREYREEVLSHNVPCGNLSHPGEVQRLLHRLGQSPLGPALKIGLLRSLMRARYDVTPLGHYGLAKQRYTHFTSPIRRYADLIVHRALFSKHPESLSALQQTAEHISSTERNSSDAERDSKDVKLFAFLESQLKSGAPEPYPALVTDVRNFGFFVDVPGLAMSGAVPLSMMEDDFYVFDPARNHLVGRRHRRIIRLGDTVTVQVARVNRLKKQVDFRVADRGGARVPQRPGGHAGAPARRSAPARPGPDSQRGGTPPSRHQGGGRRNPSWQPRPQASRPGAPQSQDRGRHRPGTPQRNAPLLRSSSAPAPQGRPGQPRSPLPSAHRPAQPRPSQGHPGGGGRSRGERGRQGRGPQRQGGGPQRGREGSRPNPQGQPGQPEQRGQSAQPGPSAQPRRDWQHRRFRRRGGR